MSNLYEILQEEDPPTAPSGFPHRGAALLLSGMWGDFLQVIECPDMVCFITSYVRHSGHKYTPMLRNGDRFHTPNGESRFKDTPFLRNNGLLSI